MLANKMGVSLLNPLVLMLLLNTISMLLLIHVLVSYYIDDFAHWNCINLLDFALGNIV